MKCPKLLLLAIVLLVTGLPARALAQAAMAADSPGAPPPDRHRLSVGFGVGVHAVREDLLVPLTSTGPAFSLSTAYAGLVGPGRIDASLELGFGFLFDRFANPVKTLPYGISVTWGLPMLRRNRWELLLGPALALDTRINEFSKWDDAHGYWLGSQWLGPSARLEGRWSDAWRFESALALGLLGFQGRPPAYRYNKQDALTHVGFFFAEPYKNESFATVADLMAIRLRAALRHAAWAADDLAGGWAFGAEARLNSSSTPARDLSLAFVLFVNKAWSF